MTSVFDVRDVRPTPDPIHPYDRDRLADVPIVIDNGSYQCRAGWAVDDHPRLVFRNVVAKQRGKKDCDVQVGNDIGNIEVVRWLLKSQFDRDVVTQYDVQEQVFDYIFAHLGIDTKECVDHPVVMTETLCNPKHSRQLMSELLFEGYRVPSVAYGIDSLFSFHRHRDDEDRSNDDGLVVSLGHHATHVIPVCDGWPLMEHARRVNIGGSHMTNFMHRLLQLKYPGHFSAVTLSRAETFVHDHTSFASDYAESLNMWADLDYYDANVVKIQLPYSPLPGVTSSSSSEALKEKRQQQIKRLQEINAKRREEKLAADEEKLRQLNSVQEFLEDGDEDAFSVALDDLGFSSARELYEAIGKVRQVIQRTLDKVSNERRENQQPGVESKSKRFSDELATKSQGDLESWLAYIRQKRQDLLDSKAQRRKRKSDMAKRRTLAAQERMKIISELAADRKKEDNFGQNDDDWQVYKAINKEAGDTDSEEENEKIGELEQILLENDPNFAKECARPEFLFDIDEYYRLYLGAETIRVPELLFQPSTIGVEQAGIGEVISFVLSKLEPEVQNRLVQNVFVTGGVALVAGFKQRLEAHLMATRAFESSFRVHVDDRPCLGAWKGASRRSLDDDQIVSGFLVSKADYEETGGRDHLKQHPASNRPYAF